MVLTTLSRFKKHLATDRWTERGGRQREGETGRERKRLVVSALFFSFVMCLHQTCFHFKMSGSSTFPAFKIWPNWNRSWIAVPCCIHIKPDILDVRVLSSSCSSHQQDLTRHTAWWNEPEGRNNTNNKCKTCKTSKTSSTLQATVWPSSTWQN